MKENFISMMERSVESERELLVSGETKCTHFINTVVPDKMRVDEEGIYLEAGDMVIDIREDFEVEYDEYEEMYIITCQDSTKYYFSDAV